MYFLIHYSIIICVKYDEKILAIKMRKSGKSYGNILKVVNVSKSTLSLWLRDIEVSKKNLDKILKGREKSRYFAALSRKTDRINRTKIIIDKAEIEFKKLINNKLFLSGLLLYWAEGDKKQERVKFANSDSNMIKLMMKWFREVCLVEESKFRIALHIHSLHSSPEVTDYWSKITGVDKRQFHKLYIKKTSLKSRKNILYEGTCSIVINSKELFRKIIGWKKGMLAHFKI